MSNLFYYKPQLLILLVLSVFGSSAYAQKRFTVTIEIPSEIDVKTIRMLYNNGKTIKRIEPAFENNKLTVSDLFYSRYATLTIIKPINNFENSYSISLWLTEQPAFISLNNKGKDLNADDYNPFKNLHIKNAFDINSLGGNQLQKFIANEKKEFESVKNQKIASEDTILQKNYSQKLKNFNNKEIEFIKKNPSLYYSFWYFHQNMLNIGAMTNNYYDGIKADSLLKIYNSTFPDSLKNSFEGQEITKRLNGRNLKKGTPAPNFTSIDVDGNTVSLADFKNKYSLLVFWASWCKPCMAEVPEIKRIREIYPQTKLEIIAINLDFDKNKGLETIKNLGMNWTHIYKDEDIVNSFGVVGIPEVFLMDQSGQIIYKRTLDETNEVTTLDELLKERIN